MCENAAQKHTHTHPHTFQKYCVQKNENSNSDFRHLCEDFRDSIFTSDNEKLMKSDFFEKAKTKNEKYVQIILQNAICKPMGIELKKVKVTINVCVVKFEVLQREK